MSFLLKALVRCHPSVSRVPPGIIPFAFARAPVVSSPYTSIVAPIAVGLLLYY